MKSLDKNWKPLKLKAIDDKDLSIFSDCIYQSILLTSEVNFDKVEKIRGLDITIVIKSLKKEDSFELLKKLNFPFLATRSN